MVTLQEVGGGIALLAGLGVIILIVSLVGLSLTLITHAKLLSQIARAEEGSPHDGELAACISDLNTAIDGLQASLSATQEELEATSEQLRRLDSAAVGALPEKTTAQSPVKVTSTATFERIQRELERDLNDEKQKRQGLELMNLSLHEEAATLRSRLSKLEKEISGERRETTATIHQSRRELEDVTKVRDAALKEIASLERQVALLSEEISTLKRSKSTRPSASKPSRAAAIVTRTTQTQTNGTSPFDTVNKEWTETEDEELLSEYLNRRNIAATAEAIRIDQKQVALRLIGLLLSPHGHVDDPTAPNHGKIYSAKDSESIVEAWLSGRKLAAVARDFGRDQLGIGWKLLDDQNFPVELTAEMIPEIVEGAHR
jgi:predicted  nucleic acid-binding Zn-ribbon protein